MEIYQDPSRSPEERVADLLPRMTLREKIGQLTQRLYGFRIYSRQGDTLEFSQEFEEEVQRYGGLGTLYGLHRADPWADKDFTSGLEGALSCKARNQVQQYVMDHSRFRIPVLMSTECPHGPQVLDGYLLPVNLAAGATFAPELLEEAAQVCGQQLKDLGVDLALVSALDVLRDPRWGRSEECFSEDPLLCSRMAGAVVRGIQSQGVSVVAKHLCAQGETTGGVNASAARIGPRELREIHLPPVKACVEAGAQGFMAAYNEIDGIYCHANPWLLRQLLREEYGFEGFVMSDGVAIDRLDDITGDSAASGALALESGVDMGLWDMGFQNLEEAVARGLVEESRIDEAARRILTLKFRRGLFDHPFIPETDHYQSFTPEAYPQVETLAEHSLVLLKNQGVLPLDPSKPRKLKICGPNADAIYNQLGDYTPPVRSGITPKQGLEALLREKNSPIQLVDGEADVYLAVVGGTSSRFSGGEFDDNGALKSQQGITMDCGENVDDCRLELMGEQLELLKSLHATGKPVITVVIGGRPYAMEQIEAYSQAIVYSFYPGPTGGQALAKLLLGDIAPAGRLPVSLPDVPGQLPVYYNPKNSYEAMRYYNAGPVRYPFGSGLSGTAFRWQLLEGGREKVAFRLENVGRTPGWAVPQLYLRRTQGVVTARARQLAGFAKVYLAPGERRDITIPIDPESLIQWDGAMRPVTPPGKILWFLADEGKTCLEGEFQV